MSSGLLPVLLARAKIAPFLAQIVGAASMLGGVTRMLISITVLAMEGSGSLQMIVPLMVAVTLAKVVGDSLSLPIYDMQIKIRGAPVLVSLSWS